MAIYLDNAATSYPKPSEVYEAVRNYMRDLGTSPGRGTYQAARKADEIIYNTRELLAELFGIDDLTRIVFTCNVTESINLALKGFLKAGDHVITTQMEHNAVWRPLKVLEIQRGIQISTLHCPKGLSFDLRELESTICPETRLVVVNHASNVTGTIMPVKEVGHICAAKKIPLLVDSAQTAGVLPINVQEMKIDLLAFSGHKGLLGPTGTGGLYIAPGIDLDPLKQGGTGGDSLLEQQPEHLPDRYEAGTLNAAGIAGLGAGVRFILDQGLEKIRYHEIELTGYVIDKLRKIPNLVIYGPQKAEERTAVISFNFSNIAPEEVTYVLDEVYEIMARSGLHCAPQAHKTIGTVDGGTVRISLGDYNTKEDVDALIAALNEIAAA